MTPGITVDNMSEADVPAGGTTLYAIWTQASTITFDANGGQQYEYVTTKTGMRQHIPKGTFGYEESAYKEDNVFLGWSTTKDFITPDYADGEMVPADGMTLYAVWAKVSIITCDANGG